MNCTEIILDEDIKFFFLGTCLITTILKNVWNLWPQKLHIMTGPASWCIVTAFLWWDLDSNLALVWTQTSWNCWVKECLVKAEQLGFNSWWRKAFLLLPTCSAWHKVTAAFYPLCTRDSSSEWRSQIVLSLRKHTSFPPHPLYIVYAQGHFSELLILLDACFMACFKCCFQVRRDE